MAVVAVAWLVQRDAVVWRARFDCLMGILEHRTTLFIILMVIYGTDPRHRVLWRMW
ncbi:hypothetical protein C2845_PM17G12890 [Panicum miliaceum]|uniref:Uncharacterized protein n=1 Tax=Panicum miliaceum TaxID=4540 RepID=A0A3L6Q6U4_PANMI|nr:hypothetical protein C2845_PM17G12890 [Panicum miliaceum]